jgi:hypothetical protein
MRPSARLAALVALAASLSVSGGRSTGAASSGELMVEDVRRSRLVHRERVAPGATFILEYRHSSEGVPVRGTFRVEGDGSLTVVRTAFAGFGPGLPELARGDDWEIAHGMIVHRPRPGARQAVRDLRLRAMAVSRPRLTTPSGRCLDLAALAGDRALVLIGVR